MHRMSGDMPFRIVTIKIAVPAGLKDGMVEDGISETLGDAQRDPSTVVLDWAYAPALPKGGVNALPLHLANMDYQEGDFLTSVPDDEQEQNRAGELTPAMMRGRSEAEASVSSSGGRARPYGCERRRTEPHIGGKTMTSEEKAEKLARQEKEKALAAEIEAGLANFTGTEHYYKASMLHPKLKITDGVKWMCEKCSAFWLVDVIVSHQPQAMRDPRLREIQFWKVKVKESKSGRRSCVVTCERDTDDVAITQRISYTDFPLDEIMLMLENDVIYLPSER